MKGSSSDPTPPALPRKAIKSWSYVDWSAVAIVVAFQMPVQVILVRHRGGNLLLEIFVTTMIFVAAGVCVWALLKCPRRPFLPKLLCLALLLFAFYGAVDWAINWAVFK